jgi:hypothetical protein
VINYIDLEAQLWQEATQDRTAMDLLLSHVNDSVRQMYQQAPFLLDRLGGIRQTVDDAVYRHFDTLEQDWSGGDWEAAVAEWASDTSQLDGAGLLDPTVVIGAISDATIVRVPQLLQALESADGTRYADVSSDVDSAIGTGPAADSLTNAKGDVGPEAGVRPQPQGRRRHFRDLRPELGGPRPVLQGQRRGGDPAGAERRGHTAGRGEHLGGEAGGGQTEDGEPDRPGVAGLPS